MARQKPGLRPPRPGDVAAVPSTSRRRSLWRASARNHSQPWFFSSRDTATDPGRFDLVSPDGTCYWALSAAGAILEATADPDAMDPPAIVVSDLDNVAVWVSDVPAARLRRLADTAVASVPTLTSEIATIVPYTLPWLWADAFHADGRTGICYRGRFAHDDAIALFGPAGVFADGPPARRSVATDHYDDLPLGFTRTISPAGTLADYDRAPRP